MLNHVLPFLIFSVAAATAVVAMIATWRAYGLAALGLRDQLAAVDGKSELRYVTSSLGIRSQSVNPRGARLPYRPRLTPSTVRRAAA